MEPNDPLSQKGMNDALRLLSFRPRSSAELRKRLKMKKHDDAVVDNVIGRLTRQGLLDDAKFALTYAESKLIGARRGRRLVERDLKAKGLPAQIVSQALEQVASYDEGQAARELVELKLKGMSGLTQQKKKARLYGLLKRRGFSNDAIFDAFRNCLRVSEDPEIRD